VIPHPSITTFDLDNARALARLALLAYGPAEGFKATFVRAIANAATDTQAYVVADERATILVFRGTSSRRDLLTDLMVRKEAVRGGRVHRGFLAAWDSVRHQVICALLEADVVGRPLFITGHSLGGALAELAESTLCASAVYTFGQPRVGNASFAAAGHFHCYRIVHEEDPVPRVPLWSWGYRHGGHEVFLDSFGHIQFNPPLPYKLLSDIWGVVNAWSQERLAVAGDHGMKCYVERLDRASLKLT
jgi:triacylglycerol lipase